MLTRTLIFTEHPLWLLLILAIKSEVLCKIRKWYNLQITHFLYLTMVSSFENNCYNVMSDEFAIMIKKTKTWWKKFIAEASQFSFYYQWWLKILSYFTGSVKSNPFDYSGSNKMVSQRTLVAFYKSVIDRVKSYHNTFMKGTSFAVAPFVQLLLTDPFAPTSFSYFLVHLMLWKGNMVNITYYT